MSEITWISLHPWKNSGSISSRKTNLSDISNVLKDIPFWQIWYLLQLVVSSSASNCDVICILGLSTGQLQTIYGSSGCIISPLFGSFVAFFFFKTFQAQPPFNPSNYKPISLVYCRSTRRVCEASGCPWKFLPLCISMWTSLWGALINNKVSIILLMSFWVSTCDTAAWPCLKWLCPRLP